MDKSARIYVPYHWDMIGGAIVRELKYQGYTNIITTEERELDLTDECAVSQYFDKIGPEYIFMFAGPHGGIIRNVNEPAYLIYANLKIECALINQAFLHKVKKMIYMSGSCIYPNSILCPVTESDYMSAPMEPTSLAYSSARMAGIELCRAYNKQYGTNFVPAILTNYYGAGDDYSDSGHVLASVLRKVADAKNAGIPKVTLWGTGTAKRQFMNAADMARALVLVMSEYNSTDLINIAGGEELTIKDMSERIRQVVGYSGEIVFDSVNPDGTLRKYLDNSKLKSLGFVDLVTFEKGLHELYEDYLKNANRRIV